jgi:hypothetical protein
MFFPSPGSKGIILLSSLREVKGSSRTTFAADALEKACSGEMINTIGSSLDLSRISLQIRLPELRIEAAFTTTKSGSTSNNRATAALPVAAVSTQ